MAPACRCDRARAYSLLSSRDESQLREEKMREMTGQCLCGQVHYSATAEPAIVAVCHSKNCQKSTGTAFSVVIGVPKSAISIEGPVKSFHDTGDSGQSVDRNFCSECGSPIFSDVALMADIVFIKAGTLDDAVLARSKN